MFAENLIICFMISTDQTRLMEKCEDSTRRTKYINQVEVAKYLQDAYNPQMQTSGRNAQTQPKPIRLILEKL